MNNKPGKVTQQESVQDNTQFGKAGEKKDKNGMDVSPGKPETSGNRRAMSPHDRGVVGAAARWQGKEAAKQIKEKLLQAEQPSSDSTATAGNDSGKKISLQERGRMGADARWHGEKHGQQKLDKNPKDEEKSIVEQPDADKGNTQKMSHQQRGHVGAAARWYGQEAAEEERDKIHKAAQDGDRDKSPGFSGGEGNTQKMSPQQRGHLGGVARWYGQDAAAEERDKIRTAAQDGDRDKSPGFSGGEGNTQKMSPQQRGHLGGVARWHGQDAAEEERDKIRKVAQDGDRDKSPGLSGGEGNITKMSPQQRGHLGGMARWHGRESIEKELQDHRDKLAGRGLQ